MNADTQAIHDRVVEAADRLQDEVNRLVHTVIELRRDVQSYADRADETWVGHWLENAEDGLSNAEKAVSDVERYVYDAQAYLTR